MDDSAIIALYRARSEEAIRETDRKYAGFCGAIAYGILRSKEDSEECVSDTWLKTWEAIPPKEPSSLKAFVGRITRNLSLDRYRARCTEKRGGGEVPLALEELGDCVSREDTMLSQLEAARMTKSIGDFLRALPKGKRDVFLLRYWYLESLAEIAEETGCTESKVKTDLYRTRRKLKQHLETEGFQL